MSLHADPLAFVAHRADGAFGQQPRADVLAEGHEQLVELHPFALRQAPLQRQEGFLRRGRALLATSPRRCAVLTWNLVFLCGVALAFVVGFLA